MAKAVKVAHGQRFGDWIITSQEPKKGGNSRVWECCRADGDKTPRALKLLNPDRFESNRYQRFKDEVNFVSSHLDEGILPILDRHLPDKPREDDRAWYVMPLAAPVSDLIDKDRHRMEAVVSLLIPVGRALERVHQRGAAHRDVKPDNILGLRGKPVVSDFGLVDYPGKIDVTAPDERMGPALFVAPELFGDAGDVDARPGDVYSLAKTLWVLTAEKRWPPPGRLDIGDSRLRLSTYCHHREGPIIDHLIDAATRTAPEERPTMSQFANELEKWLELVSMPADEPSPRLEDLRKRFAASAAAVAGDVAKDRELKQSASAAFARLEPAVKTFIVEAASAAHGKWYENSDLRKLPAGAAASDGIITRREALASEVRLTYGCYCEGRNATFEGLALQIHIVGFTDSTTEICVSLFTARGELRNHGTSTPGIRVINGNPLVTFPAEKVLWSIDRTGITGSASLAATIKQIGVDLQAQLQMALLELQLLIKARR